MILFPGDDILRNSIHFGSLIVMMEITNLKTEKVLIDNSLSTAPLTL